VGRKILYGELAGYYDRIYQFKDYRRESQEILRLARRYLKRRPRSLLDVGCGTGHHLEEFAPHVRVAGVDESPEMLRVARTRLGRKVPLTQGDMRRFSLRTHFDVLTCLFSAIGYLRTPHDRDRALSNFYRHLVPGGVALVEGWVLPSRWRGTSLSLDTYEDPDIRLARVASAWREGEDSVVEFQYLIGERGQRIRHFAEVHRQPLVPAEEMLGSFRRAGFRAKVLLGGRYRDRGLYVGVRPPLGEERDYRSDFRGRSGSGGSPRVSKVRCP
jgi:SAM-dependent methyltransferase